MDTRRLSIALSAATLVVLASCSTAASTPHEFERAQADGDELPTAITHSAEVVPDSTRYVADWHATSVYVARSTREQGSLCAVVLRQGDPSQWASSCDLSGGAVTLSFAGHQYRLGEGPDGSSDERPTQLTEGLYAVS